MQLDIPNRFESERLTLRSYQDGDEIIFLDMLKNGNREYLDELLGPISQATDIDEVKSYLNELIIDWNTRKRFVLSYWLKDSAKYLGHIWIEPQSWNLLIFEIGWFVVIDKQGEGFATEAARCALKFLFIHLNAQKIIVTVRDHGEFKTKSVGIAKKCGFVQEGYSRNSVRIFTSKGSGPIVGEYHFVLLRSEAAANRLCANLK